MNWRVSSSAIVGATAMFAVVLAACAPSEEAQAAAISACEETVMAANGYNTLPAEQMPPLAERQQHFAAALDEVGVAANADDRYEELRFVIQSVAAGEKQAGYPGGLPNDYLSNSNFSFDTECAQAGYRNGGNRQTL